MEELERMTEDGDGGLLGLPETETELDVSFKLPYSIMIFRFVPIFESHSKFILKFHLLYNTVYKRFDLLLVYITI